MALFLVRAGSNGEFENKFIEDNRVYLRWGGLFPNTNISSLGDYEKIKQAALSQVPDEKAKKIINGAGQINAFVHGIAVGDWVVLPLKRKPAIAIGVVKSSYQFDHTQPQDFQHYRDVEWLNAEVPRSIFDQDLLFSFGAFMTICQINRNDAENRVKALAKGGWQKKGGVFLPPPATDEGTEEGPLDLAVIAQDQLVSLIGRRFKGHDLERLVEAILRAQGFHTWRTSGGADMGIDILAAPGGLGFESPRICVQVKSQESPVDFDTYQRLNGAMSQCKATHGLLVAWGGFRRGVEKKATQHFFDVRFWDSQDLIEQLLAVYDMLDADIKAELPLKQVWIVTAGEDG